MNAAIACFGLERYREMLVLTGDAAIAKEIAEGDPSLAYSDAARAEFDALPLLAEDTLADFQLASEMIGADANLAYANRREQIDDLILGPDGRPRFAVVTDAANPDQIGQVVIGADALQVAQGDGDGTLLIELDPADFASAKTMQVADNGK